MIQIKEAVSLIKKTITNQGKFVFTISAILILFFILAVIAAIVQCTNKPPKAVKPYNEVFVPDSTFVQPQSGSFRNKYYFSRSNNEKWDKNEVNRWFKKPDDSLIEELAASNDELVQEITGAAP